jgi:putative redox protein
MKAMRPLLEVEALAPLDGRRTAITWLGHDWRVEGDNHANHGGNDKGPDGFDLVAAALGQCLLTTLLARAQRDGVRIDGARAVVGTKARLQGNEKAPYISDFEVDLYLDGEVDEGARAALEEATRTMCGVRETLVQTPRIVERVHVVDR